MLKRRDLVQGAVAVVAIAALPMSLQAAPAPALSEDGLDALPKVLAVYNDATWRGFFRELMKDIPGVVVEAPDYPAAHAALVGSGDRYHLVLTPRQIAGGEMHNLRHAALSLYKYPEVYYPAFMIIQAGFPRREPRICPNRQSFFAAESDRAAMRRQIEHYLTLDPMKDGDG